MLDKDAINYRIQKDPKTNRGEMRMFPDYIAAMLVILLLLAAISVRKKPDYCNHHLNGVPFSSEKVSYLIKKRKTNNPYDEPVGRGTDRCQYCGSNHIDREFREATSILSTTRHVRNCYHCGETIEAR